MQVRQRKARSRIVPALPRNVSDDPASPQEVIAVVHPELTTSMNRVRRADDLERARQHRLIADFRAARRDQSPGPFWRRVGRVAPADLDRAV